MITAALCSMQAASTTKCYDYGGTASIAASVVAAVPAGGTSPGTPRYAAGGGSS